MSLPQTAAHLQAEQTILAAVLYGGVAFDFADLQPEDFFFALHRKLYARLRMMDACGEPITILAVLDSMRLDEVEQAAVAQLNSSYGPFTPENMRSYVRIVKRDARLRALRKVCNDVAEATGDMTGLLLDLQARTAAFLEAAAPGSAATSLLGSCSTAELFSAQEKTIEWLCWPLAAVGLTSILDALPKVGKTVLILHGILASREHRSFLNLPTKAMRVCFVSEQSRASLAIQAREVGFTGEEPIEELRWITREDWSRHVYADFLGKLEKEIIEPGSYNCLVIDTLHTVARMEDEKDASEVNRLGNLTIDIAARNHLALVLGRHDRKSGGEIGVSGRSSIQLSGLVDVILHLLRVPNQPTQRKLELLGRVPGLPNEQLIDLVNGAYINWGLPVPVVLDREAQVREWLAEQPDLTGEQIVARFAAMIPPIKISWATAKRYKAAAKSSSRERSPSESPNR